MKSMEKLITFAVPCYNSRAYMRKCIESLINGGGEEIEIIIVNDGSTDDTGAIADGYAADYPEVVRAVHKPNGGHGSGVNKGLELARGLYFKVVDSDDWADEEALKSLLRNIRERKEENALPDLYITNFVYDHACYGTHVSRYTKKFAADKTVGWDKVKRFRFSHMLLMHALTYKTQVLRDCGIKLPEHTFYVDNIFAYQPLPYAKTVRYLDIDLYHYYIGRSDQSVNVKNIVRRYSQQINVMLVMIEAYGWREIKKMPKGLKRYMWHALQAIMMNTIFFTCAEYSEERKCALKEMWRRVKQADKKLYRKLRHASYATSVNYLGWRLRGWVLTKGYYRLCRKVKLG